MDINLINKSFQRSFVRFIVGWKLMGEIMTLNSVWIVITNR